MNDAAHPNANIMKLNLSHSNLSMKVPEVRIDITKPISQLKNICERTFGTSVANMQLILQDANGNSVAALNEDDRSLEHYAVKAGYGIHVIDLDPNSITKEIEDVSQVEKYTMSEEDYNNLPDNFRKFKENYIKTHQNDEKVEEGTSSASQTKTVVVQPKDNGDDEI